MTAPLSEAGHGVYDYHLTSREMEILRLMAAGRADKEIARHLGVSPYTIQTHVRHILTKMKCSSRTEASVRALREGLIV